MPTCVSCGTIYGASVVYCPNCGQIDSITTPSIAISTFSPDGQWMWTGSEWAPTPPASPLSSTSIEHSSVMIQQTEHQIVENAGEIRLQQETLQEITSFTDWTSIFISFEYRKKSLWILFSIFASIFIGFWIGVLVAVISFDVGLFKSDDTFDGIVFLIVILCLIIGCSIAFKKFMNLRDFDKENGKKKYSLMIFRNKSWTKQLDPMITKYEHLINWTQSKQSVETKRKLMEIEIELKRLLKARRRSQVLTAVVAGVAVGAAVKGFNQTTGRK